MTKKLALLTIILFVISCSNSSTEKKISEDKNHKPDTSKKTYADTLEALEAKSVEKNTDTFGKLISKIEYNIKTDNLKDYKNGFIPWIQIEHPENDLNRLLDKDKIVIPEKKVTIVIDYPLSNEYRFNLSSSTGFTKAQLIKEISKNYYKIYDEEEMTATIKTIPISKRTKMYNRNQTNGKYGIWGHDIADLVLADILVYKTPNGEILLSLEMES